MSTPTYRKAVRHRYYALAILGIVFVGAAATLYPVNTPYKVVVFAALLISGAVISILDMRRVIRSCVCNNCGVELFALTEVARAQRVELTYCPSCGHKQ